MADEARLSKWLYWLQISRVNNEGNAMQHYLNERAAARRELTTQSLSYNPDHLSLIRVSCLQGTADACITDSEFSGSGGHAVSS